MNMISAGRSRVCGTLAAVALLFGGAVATASAQTPPSRDPTIAVLPLENDSGDAAQDFFAGGMTDELAGALVGVRGLNVVARSSSFLLPPAMKDTKAIGATLNARYLVQGTARLLPERVRLNVRLVQASDGVALWSKEYDAERASIFDLEEDIGGKIAAALKLSAAPGVPLVRSRTADFDAYLGYLHGKVAARPRGAKALSDAAAFLEPVVTREPDFAPASALLAYAYSLTPLFAPSLRGGMPEEERKIVDRVIPKSDTLAHHATQVDPNNADGFVALAYANMVQRKMLAAEDAFKQALALNPNQADGLHGYSQLVAALGRIKDSLPMRDHLQAVEQSIINYTADTAEIYWLDGDTEKAVAMLEPFRPGRTLELALVQASAGRYREAAVAVREMAPTSYPAGMVEAAASILDAAPAKAVTPATLPRLGNLSFAFMHVGAPERVLEFYEDEIKGNYFQPISSTWFWHPTYAAVRKTARFKQVARDLGLVEYWRARGWPAQCHPVGANDFACG
jgi:adenylate cyclase